MKKILLAGALLSASMSLTASECGLYLFGGGGVSSSNNIEAAGNLDIDGVFTDFDSTLIASNLTGSADVGLGYNFTSWLGLQADFVYWGNQDYGVNYQFAPIPITTLLSSSSRTYSYGVEAVAYVPVCCNSVNPFVKVGYARYHSDWRFRSNTGVATEEHGSFTNTGNGLIFGAGIAFAINRCFDLSFLAQALYTDKQNILSSHVTLVQYSVNLVYHFGDLCCW